MKIIVKRTEMPEQFFRFWLECVVDQCDADATTTVEFMGRHEDDSLPVPIALVGTCTRHAEQMIARPEKTSLVISLGMAPMVVLA